MMAIWSLRSADRASASSWPTRCLLLGDVAAGGVTIEQALDDWVDCESLQGGIRKRQAAVDFDSKLHKPSTSEVWVERIDKSKKRVEKTKGLTSSKWR